MYSSSVGYSQNGIPIDEGNQGVSATLQKVFEPIFYQYGVDLVFNGHVHSYGKEF